MSKDELRDFHLVGGTALSLYFGHRVSDDLDLFATRPFSNDVVISAIGSELEGFTYRNASDPVGLFCFVDDLKIDFIQYHFHPLIDQLHEKDGIRMFSLKDIMAMKVSAILKRAMKKDFWDMHELLQHFSMEECIAAYQEKFPSQQLLIAVPQALIYFEDAEESDQPVCLKGLSWERVKNGLREKVQTYLR
jgi:hypothetical protein